MAEMNFKPIDPNNRLSFKIVSISCWVGEASLAMANMCKSAYADTGMEPRLGMNQVDLLARWIGSCVTEETDRIFSSLEAAGVENPRELVNSGALKILRGKLQSEDRS